MRLYTYFRSSAAYRVRIALNLKGVQAEMLPVHLVKDGGMQLQDAYRTLNPEALVPALDDGGQILTQSLAIIEYLDETVNTHPLLPNNPLDRAWVRALSLSIACEIHPLNNLRVLRYLSNQLHVSEDDKNAWYRHWCSQGLAAVENHLVRDARSGQFCFGDTPGMADCCLVPQVFNAVRFKIDLSAMPTIVRINEACLQHPAFIAAQPASQPDSE